MKKVILLGAAVLMLGLGGLRPAAVLQGALAAAQARPLGTDHPERPHADADGEPDGASMRRRTGARRCWPPPRRGGAMAPACKVSTAKNGDSYVVDSQLQLRRPAARAHQSRGDQRRLQRPLHGRQHQQRRQRARPDPQRPAQGDGDRGLQGRLSAGDRRRPGAAADRRRRRHGLAARRPRRRWRSGGGGGGRGAVGGAAAVSSRLAQPGLRPARRPSRRPRRRRCRARPGRASRRGPPAPRAASPGCARRRRRSGGRARRRRR